VEALNGVVGRFLAEGYLPSAKHDFQLLRVLQVGPRHMVFNVDLLHPKEAEEGFSSEMFVKHMDLGVVVSDLLPAHAFTRSIVTPHAAFILEDERSALVQVECRLPTWVCSSDLAPLGRLVLI
jgi:hypothetical protein